MADRLRRANSYCKAYPERRYHLIVEGSRRHSFAGVTRLAIEKNEGEPSAIYPSSERIGGHRAGPTWKGCACGNAEVYSQERAARKTSGGSMTYTVIYEKGPTSWGAYVPDLPGVITVGDSREEVERLIQEAIEFHIEGMREEGLAIPPPSSFAGVVEIDPAA
jgi:predicted RNase H-like HicB family nuclease